MNEYAVPEILDVIMLAGRMMLENGAETYRVEDTLNRMGKSYELKHIHVFVVPTAIILTVTDTDGQDYTELLRMIDRDTNLDKVSRVNALSRELAQKSLAPAYLKERLEEIDQTERNFESWQRECAIAIACLFFPFLFGGSWGDMIPAMITGGLGHLIFNQVNKMTNVTFFAEMTASFFIGWCALVLTSLGLGESVDIIIISSVMSMVPGMAITNSLRDLMAGHLLAGVALIAKALLTAAAIGIGIAMVLAFI